MRHVSLLITVMFFIAVSNCHSKKLYCFNCLSVDCRNQDQICLNVIEVINERLSDLYHVRGHFEKCPDVSNIAAWRLMQIENHPSLQVRRGEATCTLGRISVQVVSFDKFGKPGLPSMYNAIVLGSAKRELLYHTRAANERNGSCSVLKSRHVTKEANLEISLSIEHCRTISDQCYQTDYCVDFQRSAIQRWKTENRKKTFGFKKIVYVQALTVVAFCSLILGGLVYENPESGNNSAPLPVASASGPEIAANDDNDHDDDDDGGLNTSNHDSDEICQFGETQV